MLDLKAQSLAIKIVSFKSPHKVVFYTKEGSRMSQRQKSAVCARIKLLKLNSILHESLLHKREPK